MPSSLIAYLARDSGALVEAIAARLRDSRGAVFHVEEAEVAREIAARMIGALRSDLEAGGTEHLRRALRAAVEEIPTKQPGFYDLRLLVRAVRAVVLDAIEREQGFTTHAQRITSDWLSELGLQVGLALIIQREQLIEQQEAELELRLAEARSSLEEKRKLSERLSDLVATVPGMVFESQALPEGTLLTTFVSDHIFTMTGYTPEEWCSSPRFWVKVVHPEDRERAAEDSARIAQVGRGSHQFRWITKDGRVIWAEVHLVALRDAQGKFTGFCGVGMDITARKEQEDERARLQAEIIELQQRQLAELSCPLIPLRDDVLVMPLVGGIDRARADNVIATLLAGIARERARFAILDITGVPAVDAETADALLRAARSVGLLGAEVVLTGIRPEVAQTLVALGADLGRIATRGTLQGGIAYAMQRGKRGS